MNNVDVDKLDHWGEYCGDCWQGIILVTQSGAISNFMLYHRNSSAENYWSFKPLLWQFKMFIFHSRTVRGWWDEKLGEIFDLKAVCLWEPWGCWMSSILSQSHAQSGGQGWGHNLGYTHLILSIKVLSKYGVEEWEWIFSDRIWRHVPCRCCRCENKWWWHIPVLSVVYKMFNVVAVGVPGRPIWPSQLPATFITLMPQWASLGNSSHNILLAQHVTTLR